MEVGGERLEVRTIPTIRTFRTTFQSLYYCSGLEALGSRLLKWKNLNNLKSLDETSIPILKLLFGYKMKFERMEKADSLANFS